MFRALALTTATLATGVLLAPGAALAADTTTPLTAAQMSAALKNVAGPTATAELPGYGGDFQATFTEDGHTASASGKFASDPVRGSGYITSSNPDMTGLTGYALTGKGEWDLLDGTAERAAAKMAGHPTAKYAFTPNAKLTLDEWVTYHLPAPSVLVVSDPRHAGTKTVHDDGTTDYHYADDEKNSLTFSADAGSVLTGVKVTATGVDETFTWNYGAQTVPLPTGAESIARVTLDRAVAYLNMAAKVKYAATSSAQVIESKSGKKTVKVANLRKWARAEVASANSSFEVKVLAIADVTGGVRISATNPWTKATAAWTVKASGKHAVARKA
ncbi:hypothetical protein [Actinoplanes sp. L3-i22]|uniref:hypothetical protein n=1 Tax=Actinoplanes sp. L3-i22 TaxID=2836373 RepID=UPI001C7534F7|nr:hypothetical protein [Actinoplanes sp. L3-i22]BCY06937.1 hypothetical protein L3i22_020250 [Actinoplanes sp. L3-i22]